MTNPFPKLQSTGTRLTGRIQVISDNKFSTKTLAAAVAPPSTDFFTSAPAADQTLDNYDASNMLVTSDKEFTIQALSVNITGGSIADIDAIINKGVVVLTTQQKEIGRFPVRFLAAAGGTFVAGAQVAAASVVGVTNGNPMTEPWQISNLTIAANQNFKATLLMPTTTPYTIAVATNVQIVLIGYEARPSA